MRLRYITSCVLNYTTSSPQSVGHGLWIILHGSCDSLREKGTNNTFYYIELLEPIDVRWEVWEAQILIDFSLSSLWLRVHSIVLFDLRPIPLRVYVHFFTYVDSSSRRCYFEFIAISRISFRLLCGFVSISFEPKVIGFIKKELYRFGSTSVPRRHVRVGSVTMSLRCHLVLTSS